MFFCAHSPLLGLINIGVQLLMILATIGSFARLDKWAAICLVPLLGWVGFAAVLKRCDLAVKQLIYCEQDDGLEAKNFVNSNI